MVRRYADAEATMGEGKKVGETGPDDAGKNLEPTTVKVSMEIICARLYILYVSLFAKIPLYTHLTLLLHLPTGIHHKTHVQSNKILL